jgi:hypothetical protein
MIGPDVLCDSLGMRACSSCVRNLHNHPDAAPARRFQPAARPPKCADWRPLPIGFRLPAVPQGVLA